MRIFIGYDPRQPLAYNVLQHSIAANASAPVSITPLILRQLPIARRGLTEFTFSRFLVPYLCGYTGLGLFLDADMVVTGDIAELFAVADGSADVYVMKEQDRFEWGSAMLFDCVRCTILTPEYIENTENNPLRLDWGIVGSLPKEWNYCVGYAEPFAAKLYHYTMGIPCWRETATYDPQAWHSAYRAMLHSVSWFELMGNSVHAQKMSRHAH